MYGSGKESTGPLRRLSSSTRLQEQGKATKNPRAAGSREERSRNGLVSKRRKKPEARAASGNDVALFWNKVLRNVKAARKNWNPPDGVNLVLFFVALTLGLLVVHSTLAHTHIFGSSQTATKEKTVSSHAQLHLFTAPKPFLGVDNVNQIRALMTWSALRPRPRITFLGEGEGYEENAKRFGATIEKRVDANFRGLPFFSSMLERANESKSDVAILINCDIMLFDDFAVVLDKVRADFDDFLIVGARWDIDEAPSLSNTNFENFRLGVIKKARSKGQLHTYGGIDLWAWNTRGRPLFDGQMPHFTYGRGKYDNWLTHEAIAAQNRDVIDVSEAVTLVHVAHDHHLVSESESDTDKTGLNRGYWSRAIHSKFELNINNYLANTVGSYRNQMGTIMHAPYKIISCYERIPFCLLKRRRPHACRCEYSSFVPDAQNDPFVVNDSRVIFCGQAPESPEEDGESRIKLVSASEDHYLTGYPSKEALLEMLSDDNLIVMTSLNFNDRVLLNNLVCNLRRLEIKNFAISALDTSLYEHGVTRGLPTFYEEVMFKSDEEKQQAEAANHVSQDKYLLLQARLRALSRVVSTGRDVVYTDVDTIWLRNPISHLKSVKGDILLLSGADPTEDANSRLSMGFVMVRWSSQVEMLMEEVLKELESTTGSDTDALYKGICGKGGEYREGVDRCYRRDMKVSAVFLSRKNFIDGAARTDMWNHNVFKKLAEQKLYIVHNSGVTTSSDKLARLADRQAIFSDGPSGLCKYPRNVRDAYNVLVH